MSFDSHKNFAYSTVASPAPSISGVTLVLAANFNPAPTPPYNIMVWPAGVNPTAANAEICRVTANSSGSLTIVRQQEGSSGRAIVVGDQVAAGITARTLTDIEVRVDRIDANIYYPEDYGAVGDGIANDTAALQAAIDAAAETGGIVQLQGPPKGYAINSAPRTDRRGNAILALPDVGVGSKSVTIRGPGAHWAASIGTTRNDSYDSVHGQPSMLGGPTNVVSSFNPSDYTQVFVTIENVGFYMPNNPAISGVDLNLVAACWVDGVAVASGAPATSTLPTHIRQFGIRTPTIACQEFVDFGLIYVYGCYTGLVANSEHFECKSLHIQWCVNAVAHAAQSQSNHVGYLSTWDCKYHITGVPTTSNPVSASGHLVADVWNIEDEAVGGGVFHTVAHLYDPSNTLRGEANVHANTLTGGGNNSGDVLVVVGGQGFKLRDIKVPVGYQAITVPASGSSYTIYRDTTYFVTGGTVSSIVVDGQALGVTSGAIPVPSGHGITFNYSVAPTVKAICM